MKIKIVTVNKPEEFENEVNKHLSDGWELTDTYNYECIRKNRNASPQTVNWVDTEVHFSIMLVKK